VAEEIGQRLAVTESSQAPELMGLDEFSVRKRHLFHTAIYNLANRTVMAVVEGQGKQKVEGYLNRITQPDVVKAVVMDMHDPFRQAIQMCLPQAKVVVDKFHLIRHVNDVLDKVRSRLQGGRCKEGKRHDLFKSRYTLLKSVENLTDQERLNLIQLFLTYPELKDAWRLKEAFRHWYLTPTRSEAERKLAELEQTITRGPLPEFKHLLPTLRKWHQEILNYFDYRITNGFVEGKNNRIKTIKRMAYGYRNLDNFRLRIMATNIKSSEVNFHTY
jgi:transposase